MPQIAHLAGVKRHRHRRLLIAQDKLATHPDDLHRVITQQQIGTRTAVGIDALRIGLPHPVPRRLHDVAETLLAFTDMPLRSIRMAAILGLFYSSNERLRTLEPLDKDIEGECRLALCLGPGNPGAKAGQDQPQHNDGDHAHSPVTGR